MHNNSSPWSFPCDFPIKVFGLASDDFETAVLSIVRQYVADLKENAISTRYSKDKKYLSLTIMIHAVSKEQLDKIYQAFNANPLILMTL